MTRLATVVCLTTAIYTFIAVTEAAPTYTCNELVPENAEHACTCTPSICTNGQPSLYWLNQDPPSRILHFRNVSRKDDGSHYTCQQNCGGTISEVTYTLNVAYGPSNMSIIGNTTFITNGSRMLNLTCQATEVNPSPVYNWTDTHCSRHSHNDTCSFEPHPESDDVINVTCKAINRITSKAMEKHVTINLMYPPATVVTISPNLTKIVKAGDTLSCTVTGGKPLVQSVIFSCDIPHPPDQNNTTNNESVTSYITIDSSDAPDDNMTCHCSAYWAPEPSYYTNSVSASFRTQFPAKMKAFTMNGQNSTVTANVTTNVTLQCEARGLPAPNITLQGPHGNDLTGNLTHFNDTHSKMEHTIVAVNDTHMGNYTCIANNNVGKNWETLTFILNVNFAPKFNSTDGHSRVTAVNMLEGGIDIELRAFPVPNNYTFTGYKDNNDLTGKDLSSDPGMFTANASQRGPGSPEVTCHIRPGHNVQKGWLYMVNISSGFGSVQYYFNVTRVPPPPVAAPTDYLPIIVGASVGAGALLIIIIIIVCCCKNKRKGEKKYTDQTTLHSNDSSTQGRSNPTFNKDDHDIDSGIDEKDSPPLDMSASKPESRPAQHHLDTAVSDGVMRKKSARGQAYEVTSLVKGGGARIAGEATKPPATNSKGGYAAPWTDLHIDMPDGQPSLNKAPAHDTAKRAGNNTSPDRYSGPGGEEYASVGEHGKGGNKKAASLMQTEKSGTAAKPAAGNTGNSAVRTSGDHYAKMDDCSGRTPGSHFYTKVDSNQKSKPPYINVPADRPLEMDPRDPSFDSPGYSTVAQASRDKGNKTSGKEMHSGAEFTDARGSDTYDHFGRQGQQSRPYDPTYAHTQDF